MSQRLIPCLLLSAGRLVKTVRFKDRIYVGDPINAVRVFNDKEVDELTLLDIDATRKRTPIDYELIADVAGEAFMPVCYGGGVSSLDQIERLFTLGIEKVSINSAAVDDPELLSRAADVFGSQSIVGAVDVARSRLRGDRVVVAGGTRRTDRSPLDHARRLAAAGAGEILLNSVDRDGTRGGYDLGLIRDVADAAAVPVVALGGAGALHHCRQVWDVGAAAAAGSIFVLHGPRRGVLISYPTPAERAAM